MSRRLPHRPGADVSYVTAWDRDGVALYVTVEDVYLPGDDPRECPMTTENENDPHDTSVVEEEEDPYARLLQLRIINEKARCSLNEEALRLHNVEKLSWAKIGAALGVTRQAAWERWGKHGKGQQTGVL